jgi:hypothetical protein
MTAKNVPPTTTNVEGTSIKGVRLPADDIIVPAIIPSAPSMPIREAKSIFSALFVIFNRGCKSSAKLKRSFTKEDLM